MTALVVYTLAALGFAYVLGHSVITKPAREIVALWAWGSDGEVRSPVWAFLLTLVECPACLGFWVGFLTGCALATSSRLVVLPLPTVLIPVLGGFYTAGTNFLFGRLTGLMQKESP